MAVQCAAPCTLPPPPSCPHPARQHVCSSVRQQGKFNEALRLLDGPVGAAIPLDAERREARAAVLLAAGRRGEAADLYRQALKVRACAGAPFACARGWRRCALCLCS